MKATFTATPLPCLFFFLLLTSFSASAQRLSRLMEERDRLYEEWEYFEDQNNAFWGGKSKEDLSNIIGVQKQIISKDNEILEEVRSQHASTQKGLRQELEATQDQLSAAKSRIGELESDLAATTELYNDSLSDIASQSGYKNSSFIFILLLLGSTAFLAFKLRKANSNQLSLSGFMPEQEGASAMDAYVARLDKIGKLKDNGLITEEDYKAQKDKILATL